MPPSPRRGHRPAWPTSSRVPEDAVAPDLRAVSLAAGHLVGISGVGWTTLVRPDEHIAVCAHFDISDVLDRHPRARENFLTQHGPLTFVDAADPLMCYVADDGPFAVLCRPVRLER